MRKIQWTPENTTALINALGKLISALLLTHR